MIKLRVRTIEQQKNFFSFLSKKLDLKVLDDWYKVSARKVIQEHGYFLNTQYGGSLYSALQTIYPSHNWKKENFQTIPSSFWVIKEEHGNLLRSLNYLFFDQ